MDELEIKQRMSNLRKQILTMEWDAKRNQLNAGRAAFLEKVRVEYKDLETQLNGEITN